MLPWLSSVMILLLTKGSQVLSHTPPFQFQPPKELDGEDQKILELLRFAFCVTNEFFHLLYGGGIWLPRETAQRAVQLGFSIGDSWYECLVCTAHAN